jgi:hypothetical protein
LAAERGPAWMAGMNPAMTNPGSWGSASDQVVDEPGRAGNYSVWKRVSDWSSRLRMRVTVSDSSGVMLS